MARIHPFRGVRYNLERESLRNVVAPPYDIIPPVLQEAYHQRNLHNVIHLELGLPQGPDAQGRDRYQRAAHCIEHWLADGVLIRDEASALYVYEEGFSVSGVPHIRRSVFAAVGLEPWERNVILPHEHTLPKPKADRLNLLRATSMQISPIFSFFDDPTGEHEQWLDAVTSRPATAEARFEDQDVAEAATTHRFWVVNDAQECAAAVRRLEQRQLFIADGHHRYETALAYQRECREQAPTERHGAYDNVMMVLVASSDPGMMILPIHRVVTTPHPLDPAAFLAGLERIFDVAWEDADTLTARFGSLAAEPVTQGRESPMECGVLGLREGLAAHVTLKQGVDVERELSRPTTTPWRSLDVAILHGLILEPLLQIGEHEIASEAYVHFERDATTARARLASDANLVFLMRPTRVEQVRDVALAHDRMPQKSTFFYPKALTGLVMYPLS